MSFKEIKQAVMREFGYFIDRIDNNHPKDGLKELSPSHESNLSKFKRSLGLFCSEFYFGDLNEAIKQLDIAQLFAHKIDTQYQEIVESYIYNRSMIE